MKKFYNKIIQTDRLIKIIKKTQFKIVIKKSKINFKNQNLFSIKILLKIIDHHRQKIISSNLIFLIKHKNKEILLLKE